MGSTWGVTDGTLFVFETLTFTYSKSLKPTSKWPRKPEEKRSDPLPMSSLNSNNPRFKNSKAFQMIDADRNGIITVGDLKATYASLGVRDLDQDMLDNMCAETGAPINFTIFLNMLAGNLHGTDPEDVI